MITIAGILGIIMGVWLWWKMSDNTESIPKHQPNYDEIADEWIVDIIDEEIEDE